MSKKRARREMYMYILDPTRENPENDREKLKEMLASLGGLGFDYDAVNAAIGLNACLDNVLAFPGLNRELAQQTLTDPDSVPSRIKKIQVYSFPAENGRMLWVAAITDDGRIYARGENKACLYADQRNHSSIRNMLNAMEKSSLNSPAECR